MQDFFAMFFEFFGTVKGVAADALYDFVYVPAGFLWIGATLIWAVLYYQGFFVWRTKARFDKIKHWIIWMFFSSLITMLGFWILAASRFQAEDQYYSVMEYLEFLGIGFFWSMVLFFVFSIPLKFTNASRRKTPF